VPHNESRTDPKSETNAPAETVTPSKFSRFKSAAISVGISTIPVAAVMVGGSLVGYKTGKMQLDAAKLNLETARLAKDIATAVIPKS